MMIRRDFSGNASIALRISSESELARISSSVQLLLARISPSNANSSGER